MNETAQQTLDYYLSKHGTSNTGVITLLIRDRWDGPHGDQQSFVEFSEFWQPEAQTDPYYADQCALADVLAPLSRQELTALAEHFRGRLAVPEQETIEK